MGAWAYTCPYAAASSWHHPSELQSSAQCMKDCCPRMSIVQFITDAVWASACKVALVSVKLSELSPNCAVIPVAVAVGREDLQHTTLKSFANSQCMLLSVRIPSSNKLVCLCLQHSFSPTDRWGFHHQLQPTRLLCCHDHGTSRC